jgi:hypothetical protein
MPASGHIGDGRRLLRGVAGRKTRRQSADEAISRAMGGDDLDGFGRYPIRRAVDRLHREPIAPKSNDHHLAT